MDENEKKKKKKRGAFDNLTLKGDSDPLPHYELA